MKVTRIFTGDDGKSHFEDIDIPLDDTQPNLQDHRSKRLKVTGLIFRETSGDYDLDFHNAPEKQFVINLSGGVELETGDGSKRQLLAGDILLAEDTTGQGHISRAINNEPRRSIFITLE